MSEPAALDLAATIREAIDENGWEVDAIEAAVRAWLALPPSADEIEAAAKAIRVTSDRKDMFMAFAEIAEAALVASRAVLVRPREETT